MSGISTIEKLPIVDRLTSQNSTLVLTDDGTDQTLTGNLGKLILAPAGEEVVFNGSISFDTPARQIAGIQNQNLLDKSAAETISGQWTFANNVVFQDDNRLYFGTGQDSSFYWDNTNSLLTLDFGNVPSPRALFKITWNYYYSSYWYPIDYYYNRAFEISAGGSMGEYSELAVSRIRFPEDDQTIFFPNGTEIGTDRYYAPGFYEFRFGTGMRVVSNYSGGGSTVFEFDMGFGNPVFRIYGTSSVANSFFRGYIYPETGQDNKFDIGGVAKRWRDIWLGRDVVLDSDTGKVKLGDGQDAAIWYDGTDLKIDSAVVGSGTIDLVSQSAQAITTETLQEYITIKVGGVLKKIAIVA